MTGGRWIVEPVPALADPAVRLFCFAHAGGGPAFFRRWRAALAPEIDVRPVLLPGRESRIREAPARRIEQVLDPLCAALLPHLDRPYVLFGHSMGAVLAYEVGRRLARSRASHEGFAEGPAAVLVSGRRAPRLPTSRRLFSTLPDAEFLREIGGLGGTPPEVLKESALLRALLPPLRADFELNEWYQPLPGPRLHCPVAAYMGAADPEVNHRELLGWHEETGGEFTMRVFDGDHFYLKDGRADVLAAVRQDVQRAAGQIQLCAVA